MIPSILARWWVWLYVVAVLGLFLFDIFRGLTLPDLLARSVIRVAVPVNWYVVWRLWRLSRSRPQLGVLRERMFVALALAVVVTIFALVFLNNGMEVPILNLEQTQLLTRTAVLSLAIPPLRWLWQYRNGG